MKTRNLLSLVIAAVVASACIPSINPFYTEKDVIFNPRLLGEWQEKGNTNSPEVWKFEQSTNNMLSLTVVEQGKTGEFAAQLFKLGQNQFLDMIPADCDYATNQADLVAFSMFPGHLLVHVQQVEPELSLAFFDFDWLEKYLKQNPKVLAHHVEGDRIVLTAETRNLQKFVLKHLGTNELFKESGLMVRRSGEASTTNSAR